MGWYYEDKMYEVNVVLAPAVVDEDDSDSMFYTDKGLDNDSSVTYNGESVLWMDRSKEFK